MRDLGTVGVDLDWQTSFRNLAPLVVFLAVGLRFVIIRKRNLPSLPPGPPKRIFLGNLLDFPTKGFEWLSYAKWGQDYGPIVSVTVLGINVIIVNNYEKAIEMMEKRGGKYSSRPWIPMIHDILGWDKAFTMVQYGPRLRAYRKYFYQVLGTPQAVSTFLPQQESHAKALAKNLLELKNHENSGQRLEELCFAHSNGLILDIAYGYTVQDKDDIVIGATQDAIHAFSEAVAPGKFLVNQFPFLRYIPSWMPGGKFKRVAKQWAPLFNRMNDIPFTYVKEQLAAGTAKESFASTWLRSNISPLEEDYVSNVAGMMYSAGGETTAITIHAFFLFLIQHPEIQTRLQIEMDDVLSLRPSYPLPTSEDRESLPYLEAVTKESVRVFPPAPFGLPHSTSEDDVFDGWWIPKDSIIIGNIWQMCRDPAHYRNPETYNPDRFMGENPEMDPRQIVFGFGRRVCPGKLTAAASIYATLAMIVALFDVLPVLDENGEKVIPNPKESGTVTNRLAPFPCRAVPRRPDRWAFLEE